MIFKFVLPKKKKSIGANCSQPAAVVFVVDDTPRLSRAAQGLNEWGESSMCDQTPQQEAHQPPSTSYKLRLRVIDTNLRVLKIELFRLFLCQDRCINSFFCERKKEGEFFNMILRPWAWNRIKIVIVAAVFLISRWFPFAWNYYNNNKRT